MAEPHRHHRYTYASYVALEKYSDTKHEFLDGQIYAMAGGSRDHAALAMTIGRELLNAMQGRDCTVQSSDFRIYMEAVNVAAFPDVSVICGPMQLYEPGPEETALNPMILVEVTSDSSEAYDYDAKRGYYQTIPTLREYIVVSHRERRVTIYVRGEHDAWVSHVATRGGRFAVPSLQTEIAVDDIYGNLDIP
ncbi:MAG: Uma2 family endonuclease [Acidobacteria bacterium]|nr:MAG: Uma2 family endonuclease [Acidobacteriota bacterium]